MNVRHGLAATTLAVGLLVLTACGSQQSGSPLPVQFPTVAGTTAAGSGASAPVTTPSNTGPLPPSSASPSPSGSTSSNTTGADTTTSDRTSAPTTVADPGPTAPGVELDQVTEQWVTGMCTDMGALLAGGFDIPTVTDKAPLAQYRQAYAEYYATLAQLGARAYHDAKGATPPTVTNGAKIHEVFLRYLTGLVDISSHGSELISSEKTLADIKADITEINKEIEDLGKGDPALSYLRSPELEAAMKTVPACKDLISQG